MVDVKDLGRRKVSTFAKQSVCLLSERAKPSKFCVASAESFFKIAQDQQGKNHCGLYASPPSSALRMFDHDRLDQLTICWRVSAARGGSMRPRFQAQSGSMKMKVQLQQMNQPYLSTKEQRADETNC
jgi:hypothetical protein